MLVDSVSLMALSVLDLTVRESVLDLTVRESVLDLTWWESMMDDKQQRSPD